MSWAGECTYYLEYKGKFYGLNSLSQRNKLVENFGFEKVTSREIQKYKIRYYLIPKENFDKFVESFSKQNKK